METGSGEQAVGAPAGALSSVVGVLVDVGGIRGAAPARAREPTSGSRVGRRLWRWARRPCLAAPPVQDDGQADHDGEVTDADDVAEGPWAGHRDGVSEREEPRM